MNKRGIKTKLLWENPEYREHMSIVHMGHNKPQNAYSFPKGISLSKKTRKKISLANKGDNNGMYGKKPWNWRRKSELCGKNHPNWKGGISDINTVIRNSIEMKLWRDSVYARDNWTCQKCGEKGGRLHSHHIKNFSQYKELRFAIDNGITLCRKHHIEFHKVYGRTNNTIEQLNKYLYD